MLYIGPLSTIFIGLVAAFIAFQQWRLAQRKLQLDLFDRRYKVYDATRAFLSEVMGDATFSDKALFQFYAGTSDAEFLFGRDVVDFLAEIRKRALDMRTHEKTFERLPVGDQRSKHVEANSAQLMWLTDQLGSLKRPFLPYMSFSKVR